MSTGEVLNPKRVRLQANERLDQVDADALSSTARDSLDAHSRAVVATPRNVGSTTPTGFIFQGFGLTLNPTAPSDAKVRVQSPLGVAIDANGRLLIKEAGVTLDITLSAGNTQIYAYYIEDASDTTVRRAISASPAFTEGSVSMPTKLKGDVGFYARAGDQTSIVASDVVNGVTAALCFLGVANNTAGAVTMTGYDSVNAPNGAFATNRLTSVAAPTTLPPANTANGSIATMHGLTNAALYMLGQAVWKGSKNFTPSAANNFGAFTLPTVGLDGLFDDQGETTFTPITRWRDWQQNIRYLVDHQGFPGGQISIKDENWVDGSGTAHFDPTAGFKVAGGAAAGTAAPFGVTLSTTGDQWSVPISLPFGAIIRSITLFYVSGNASNTLTGALNVVNLSAGTSAAQVSRTVTTATGNGQSFDAMATPTSGHGPKLVRPTERLLLSLSCTISASTVIIKDVQVGYVLPPKGWSAITLATTDLITNGDVVNFTDPISGLNQRCAQFIATGNAAAVGLIEFAGPYEVYVDNDLAHTMEFIIHTGIITDAGNAHWFSVEIVTQSGPAWGIQRQFGGNWLLILQDDTHLLQQDSGVTPANNTQYRVKIDFQAVNRNSAGAPTARLWINGALVATAVILGGVLTPSPGRIFIQAQAALSVAGPYDVRVGRLHRAWNHLAAGDNV